MLVGVLRFNSWFDCAVDSCNCDQVVICQWCRLTEGWLGRSKYLFFCPFALAVSGLYSVKHTERQLVGGTDGPVDSRLGWFQLVLVCLEFSVLLPSLQGLCRFLRVTRKGNEWPQRLV